MATTPRPFPWVDSDDMSGQDSLDALRALDKDLATAEQALDAHVGDTSAHVGTTEVVLPAPPPGLTGPHAPVFDPATGQVTWRPF
jgi:hypothetical protein